MSRFKDLLNEALQGRGPFALGIITSIKGSSPQKKGAKALFLPDGRILGTLGGGCLEAEIQDRARRAMMTGEPATFDLVLDHDFGWDDGLICGGKVSGLILPCASEATGVWQQLIEQRGTVKWGVRRDYTIRTAASWDSETEGDWLYSEIVEPPWALWIAGSGHVAQAVAPLASQLDFEVTIFDDRPALANPRYFPTAAQFHVGSWEHLLDIPLPTRPAFGLVLTRGHQHDAQVLARWIQRPFRFLGMIGSRRKRRVIFDQFLADGTATSEQLARVACPVGIDLHAVTVPEIALSVMAQCVAVRAEQRGALQDPEAAALAEHGSERAIRPLENAGVTLPAAP
jgi:xanthine dehydrogenase accessory factor